MVEIKVFLLRKGWTQSTIARDLGITKQYLGDILHGDRKAIHIRQRLIHEYGFPADLVEWNPERRAA